MSSESESPESQKAKTLFQYGNDAMMKSNIDYAIAMYRQACKHVPDNMMYRQSLRGAERKKFNNDPKKVGMLVGVKNQPLLIQAKSARSKGKHNEALEHCEDAFANNPWDVGAARVAAEAAEGLGLGGLSQWLLDSVQEVAAKGKDADFFRFAAGIYETNESWHKAIACWEQVKKFNPNDQDVSRKINALSAASTIKRAGLDDALDSPAQAKPAEEAAESMQAKLDKLKQEQLTPEQRLIKEIVADPTATHAYVELADIYRLRGDLEKAEKVLAKGLKANPNDQGLMQIYEDTQISRLKRAIEGQKHRVQEQPEETAAQVKLDELTKMLDKYEIQAYPPPGHAPPRGRQAPLRARIDPRPHRRPRRGHPRVPAGGPPGHRPLGQDPGPAPDGAELRGQRRAEAGRAELQRGRSSSSIPRTRITSSPCTTASAASPRPSATARPPRNITTKWPPPTTRTSTSPSDCVA